MEQLHLKSLSDRELVDQLCNIEAGLTEWEAKFVDGIERWLRGIPRLDAKQRSKAEEILAAWEERDGEA